MTLERKPGGLMLRLIELEKFGNCYHDNCSTRIANAICLLRPTNKQTSW